MRSIYKLAALLPASLMLLAGCAKIDEDIQFVRLEETTYSFQYKDNEPQTVVIEASGQWQAEASVSWIEIVEQTAGGAVINVQDNIDATEMRGGKIIITCGQASETVYVYQLGNTYNEWTYRYPIQFDLGAVVSPNGRYIAGRIPELQEDNSYISRVIFIDTETGEWHEVAEIPNSLFAIEKPYAVTDQGQAFFLNTKGNDCVIIDLEGNITKVQAPEEYKYGGHVQCVSADGRLWGGYVSRPRSEGIQYMPALWTDGVAEVLPIPELNYHNQPHSTGILLRGMSHDGSVLYGSTWDNNDFGMVYWKKDASGKYQVDYVARDRIEEFETEVNGKLITRVEVDGMTVQAQCTNISPNGKYIAGIYREEHGDVGNWVKYPGFLNTETGEVTTFPTHDGGGVTATDDGIGFITNGTVMPTSGAVVDIDNGVMLGSVEDWVYENYGIHVSFGYITYVCPNGTLKAQSKDLGPIARTVTWIVSPSPKEN